MLIPRLRNTLIFKSSEIPLKSIATQFANIHSTPFSCHKHNNKSHFDAKGGSNKQQPKNHIRIAIRQRRAGMKKALDDLLYKIGSPKFSLQEEESSWKLGWQVDKSDNPHKKHKSKYSARNAPKSHQKKNKRKPRMYSFYEVFNDYETNAQSESFYKRPETDWNEHINWNRRRKSWESISDSEFDNETYTTGSSADRTLLGLPPSGPLKIDDVKKAFHLSALKWHPDKHQGPSQVMAEEKFKLCVDAYKSLCKLLSTA